MDPSALESDPLISALLSLTLYDHPVKNFAVIETHISWVILTGLFAYKIKKPVNYGFIDFSTLALRKHYCDEELRLNRRFAPELYLEVIAITGSRSNPSFRNGSPVIEYAVKMREFSQQELLSSYAKEQRLTSAHIDLIADTVANTHASAPSVDGESTLGSADTILKWSNENIEQVDSVMPERHRPDSFRALKKWVVSSSKNHLTIMHKRKQSGFVRECHGDLHLGNMIFHNNKAVLFDCIEFNHELRWIDTSSEIAFIAMDLQARGYPEFSWRFLNRYFLLTGDYESIQMLRYYFVYRCLVRCKVEALQVRQTTSSNDSSAYKVAFHYLHLATTWSRNSRPAMIIMHGLSGSGKSTVASALAESIGAVQIRSDIERKRLFGLSEKDQSESNLNTGLYSAQSNANTYQRLVDIARMIIQAGHTVIVDATFIKRSDRIRFKQIAQHCRVPFALISCEAPDSVLEYRIKQRIKSQADASEANLSVLHNQIKTQESLTEREYDRAYIINGKHIRLPTEQLHALLREISIADPNVDCNR